MTRVGSQRHSNQPTRVMKPQTSALGDTNYLLWQAPRFPNAFKHCVHKPAIERVTEVADLARR